MRLVTPILKRIVYPCLSSAGWFSASARSGLGVITYHGVLPPGYRLLDPGFDGSLITSDTFRQQIRLLKKKYTIISPEEVRIWLREGGELPPRAMLLTCDDGFLSNLTEMLPILQDEGLRCLFFITGASTDERRTMLWYENLLLLCMRAPAGKFSMSTKSIEISGIFAKIEQRHRVWWEMVKRLSQISPEARQEFLDTAYSYFGLEDSFHFFLATYPQSQRHFCLLTPNEVEKLAASGMTIGAHTMTHPILSQLPRETIRCEIAESRSRLETLLKSEVWAFAYPFGGPESVNCVALDVAKELGFEAAFVNCGGGLGTLLPVHSIPRVHVNAGMSLAEFEAHISGFYQRLRNLLSPSVEGISFAAKAAQFSSPRSVAPVIERAS